MNGYSLGFQACQCRERKLDIAKETQRNGGKRLELSHAPAPSEASIPKHLDIQNRVCFSDCSIRSSSTHMIRVKQDTSRRTKIASFHSTGQRRSLLPTRYGGSWTRCSYRRYLKMNPFFRPCNKKYLYPHVEEEAGHDERVV